MMKMKKEKLFISLVMVLVVIFMLGTVSSFATELTVSVSDESEETTNTAANTIGATIKASNTTKKTNTTTKNTVKNTVTKNTVANNADKNTVNIANKVSNYANKTGSTSLPYAGTDTTIIFVVAALGISAVYAYKKVVDYNI